MASESQADDHQIGAIVRVRRGEQSQKALADAMRAKGHPWSQSTVWSIESGTRPLRLIEARDLADIWGVDIDQLLPERAAEVRHLQVLVSRLGAKAAVIASQCRDLVEPRDELQAMLNHLEPVPPGEERVIQDAHRVLALVNQLLANTEPS